MNASIARFLSLKSATLLVAATLAAAAAASDVVATKSRVTATFSQMNVPVEGNFKNFRGDIRFDPKNLKAARARIEIDTASFELGAPEYDEELRGKEWFDTSTYPKARFVSSHVVTVGENRFEAKGKLTLKGKTQEINVPFTLRSDGSARVFDGELPISRKLYAIGGAEWDDTLDDQVIVKFHIAITANK